MAFYNGSVDGNIKEFKVVQSRDGFVYATSSWLVALTYIARVFPNLFMTENDKEVFIDVVPNFFENTVKGRSGYLYTLEDNQDFIPIKQNQNCGHANVYKINEDVKVKNVEFIEDVFKELQKYIESGELVIKRYSSLDQEQITKIQKQILELNKNTTNIKTNCVNLIENYLKIKK